MKGDSLAMAPIQGFTRATLGGLPPAQQECFLRCLSSYRIPSILEPRYEAPSFSPLRFVLLILEHLNDAGMEARLSFTEFALFFQTSTPDDDIGKLVKSIADFRAARKDAEGKVRAFERQWYDDVANGLDRTTGTLQDYADLTLRYLKATGLLHAAGRGISITPMRAKLASLLTTDPQMALDDHGYLRSIWLGAKLPTDEPSSALAVVNDLVKQLEMRGVEVQALSKDTPMPDLEVKRLELETIASQLDEREFADNQSGQVDAIIGWLEAVQTRRPVTLGNGEIIVVPKAEAPAYMEWSIWRAFLAINSLVNEPWAARRFQIDQDLLPVSCAPGGGPDMIFEFQECIVVVEVTLTTSSRQEAAEGEPVRRHVANYADASGKPVYGLFIAVAIDSNTANTFRLGDWYRTDDSKLSLDIVPMALEDFAAFLSAGRDRLSALPGLLERTLIECRAKANQDAPQWKKSISEIVQKNAQLP